MSARTTIVRVQTSPILTPRVQHINYVQTHDQTHCCPVNISASSWKSSVTGLTIRVLTNLKLVIFCVRGNSEYFKQAFLQDTTTIDELLATIYVDFNCGKNRLHFRLSFTAIIWPSSSRPPRWAACVLYRVLGMNGLS